MPPAAKEGKGDCEFPLCPPWILLLPLCNAGHCVPRGGYGIGLLSIELSIIGGRFYDTWLIWERCSLAPLLRPCANCVESLSLSESERCSYRSLTIDCIFRAHSNLWWARHGWPLIHLVSRPDGQFSRPPYFTAGVNLTAEISSEPPRGGEHGAGANCLNKKPSFAESRN